MKVQHVLGADLSKKTIDLVCHLTGCHLQIENTDSGFEQLREWVKQQGLCISATLLVMEHTGLYSYLFEKFLFRHQIAFTKISALQIKRSMGLVRGKTDKIDARRIAAYGWEKREQLSGDAPVSKPLERLQMLNATRERLVKQRAALCCAVKEYRQTAMKESDLVMQSQLQVIKALDKNIAKLDTEILRVVAKTEELKKNYDLLQSITGVGKEIAVATLIKTHNFSRFTDGRKFACFCGTAPFEHSSGSSIRGRTKVSHLADKRMKTLLEMGARTAIQHDKELREFYQRRTAGGKSKTSTLNIVRNKIIYRMFAVVKRGTPFIKNYLPAA